MSKGLLQAAMVSCGVTDNVVSINSGKPTAVVNQGPAPHSALVAELEALAHPDNQKRLVEAVMALGASLEAIIPAEAKAELAKVLEKVQVAVPTEVKVEAAPVTTTGVEQATTSSAEAAPTTAIGKAMKDAMEKAGVIVAEGDDVVTLINGKPQVIPKPKANLPE